MCPGKHQIVFLNLTIPMKSIISILIHLTLKNITIHKITIMKVLMISTHTITSIIKMVNTIISSTSQHLILTTMKESQSL